MSEALQKTGAQILHDVLLREGVEVIFGYPGSDMLPFYDQLYESQRIRHVLVRHEQAAAHAADGYARVSGKTGVCMATSGPGSTNLITGIAAAYADSVPIVALTFNAPSHHFGKGVFQEADMMSISKTIVKKNWRITSAEDVSAILGSAFRAARAYPQGPVLIDIPSDILRQNISEVSEECSDPDIPSKQLLSEEELSQFFSLLSQAKRPVFIAGNGVIQSQSHEYFRSFIEKIQMPTATTVSGVGSIDEQHPLALHVVGVLGTPYANSALQKSDLIVAWGMHLEPRSTARPEYFAPDAKIIQIDIDHGVCGRFIQPSYCFNGNIYSILSQLLGDSHTSSLSVSPEWLSHIALWKHSCALQYDRTLPRVQPHSIMEKIEKYAPHVRIFAGNGLHKYWALRWFSYKYPRQFNTNSRFGAMGFALPGALGASLALKNELIIVVTGDGDIQMTIQEFDTVVHLGAPLKIVCFNNRSLGAIRQHQHASYGDRFIGSTFDRHIPIDAIARAYGIPAVSLVDPIEADATLSEALTTPGPYLVNIILDPDTYLEQKISVSDSLDSLTCPVEPLDVEGK